MKNRSGPVPVAKCAAKIASILVRLGVSRRRKAPYNRCQAAIGEIRHGSAP